MDFYKQLKMMMKQQGIQGDPLPNLVQLMTQQNKTGSNKSPNYYPQEPQNTRQYPHPSHPNQYPPGPHYLPQYSYMNPMHPNYYVDHKNSGSDLGSIGDNKTPPGNQYPYYGMYPYSHGPSGNSIHPKDLPNSAQHLN